MRRWIVVPFLALLLFASAPARAASPTFPSPQESVARLVDLGVIAGVYPKGERVDYNLSAHLTRAELATVIVRAFGREEAARAPVTAPPFADVAPGSWYTGYVAQAKELATEHGITLGYGEGLFDPNRELSRVEALILPLKLIGQRPTASGSNWYSPWIDLAYRLNLLTVDEAASLEANPSQPSTRGESFVLLDRLFYADLRVGGRSVYKTYIDSVPPTIEQVSWPAETGSAQIRIGGLVRDDRKLAGLWVNGQPAELVGDVFNAPLTLSFGANPVELRAIDLAGNETIEARVIQRRPDVPTALKAAPFTIEVGARYYLNPALIGGDGKVLPGPFTIKGESRLGTYQDGWFTAGSVAGQDTLFLQSGQVNLDVPVTVRPGPAKGVVTRQAKVGELVPLTLADEWGNPIAGVTWSPGTEGALVQSSLFQASAAGRYSVVGTLSGQRFTGVILVDTAPAAGDQSYVHAPMASWAAFIGEPGWTDKAAGQGLIAIQALDDAGRPVADGLVEIVVDVTGPGLQLQGGALQLHLQTNTKGYAWVPYRVVGGQGGRLRIRSAYAGSTKLTIIAPREIEIRP